VDKVQQSSENSIGGFGVSFGVLTCCLPFLFSSQPLSTLLFPPYPTGGLVSLVFFALLAVGRESSSD